MLHEFAQATALIPGLVLRSLQQEPARLREEGLTPALSQRVDLGAADLIDRVAHVLGDMKPVQDVEGVARLLGHDLEVRLPHVAANEREHGRALLPEPAEESEERLRASVLADPQQALVRRVDLVDEREELAPALPVD